MEQTEPTYLPAAGHHWGLPLYDPLVKLLGGDRARRTLIEQAALFPRARVLDVGCGTGTLMVLTARLHPDVELVGLDPDPQALDRARRKAHTAAVGVHLDRGFSTALPYPDASFDRVFSSFMLHHLQPEEKATTLREVLRVLKPGGSLHLLDFTPADGEERSLLQWLHSHHRLSDNTQERVVRLMRDAGFTSVSAVTQGALFIFRTMYYRAVKAHGAMATA